MRSCPALRSRGHRQGCSRDHFAATIFHYTRDVSMQILFLEFRDNPIAMFDGKNNVDVELGVGVCHGLAGKVAPYGALSLEMKSILQTGRTYGAVNKSSMQ
jgi:hypothetical protein